MSTKKNDHQGKKAAAATGAGAVAGALTPAVVGGMGPSIGGSAIAIGLVPLAIAGGIVGLAGYGLYRAFKK